MALGAIAVSSTRGASVRHYRLFGLEIASELLLPELFESSTACETDVIIRVGPIEAPANVKPGVHELPAGVLIVVDRCARYLVSTGSEILVEPHADSSPRNVRLFLLGSALGLLLHQRKLLPLHANSIEIDGRAIAFMGPSGVGKSTLAAWFHGRGFRILADDVSVIDFDSEGLPIVHPGLPRLRLWEEVLIATGRDPKDFHLSFEGDEAYRKRDVLIPSEGIADTQVPLAAAVLLTDAASDLKLLTGALAVDALFSNTYRGAFVELSDTIRDHWIACTTLAITIPIFEVGLRHGLDQLDQSCEKLLRSIRSQISPARR